MDCLIHLEVQGHYAGVHWHKSGGGRDPYRFFMGLEKKTISSLKATFRRYAEYGEVGTHRGHDEGWEYEDPGDAELVLYKFKEKEQLVRFYAVVHFVGGERRAVIIYGFQPAKKTKSDSEEKKRAEEAAKKYLNCVTDCGCEL